jgi:hypothetical protein
MVSGVQHCGALWRWLNNSIGIRGTNKRRGCNADLGETKAPTIPLAESQTLPNSDGTVVIITLAMALYETKHIYNLESTVNK